jgi:hypothetical protein
MRVEGSEFRVEGLGRVRLDLVEHFVFPKAGTLVECPPDRTEEVHLPCRLRPEAAINPRQYKSLTTACQVIINPNI